MEALERQAYLSTDAKQSYNVGPLLTLCLLLYPTSFDYGYLPTINHSEIVVINQLNPIVQGPHIVPFNGFHHPQCVAIGELSANAIPSTNRKPCQRWEQIWVSSGQNVGYIYQ